MRRRNMQKARFFHISIIFSLIAISFLFILNFIGLSFYQTTLSQMNEGWNIQDTDILVQLNQPLECKDSKLEISRTIELKQAKTMLVKMSAGIQYKIYLNNQLRNEGTTGYAIDTVVFELDQGSHAIRIEMNSISKMIQLPDVSFGSYASIIENQLVIIFPSVLLLFVVLLVFTFNVLFMFIHKEKKSHDVTTMLVSTYALCLAMETVFMHGLVTLLIDEKLIIVIRMSLLVLLSITLMTLLFQVQNHKNSIRLGLKLALIVTQLGKVVYIYQLNSTPYYVVSAVQTGLVLVMLYHAFMMQKNHRYKVILNLILLLGTNILGFFSIIPYETAVSYLQLGNWFLVLGFYSQQIYDYLDRQRTLEEEYEHLSLSQTYISEAYLSTEKYVAEVQESQKSIQTLLRLSKSPVNKQRLLDFIHQQIEIDQSIQKVRYCESPILNSLINHLANECCRYQIEFESQIRVQTTIKMSQDDITSLFSNLFSNAVEASIKDRKERKISLLVKQADEKLYIQLVNNDAMMILSTKGRTTKENKLKHGYGLYVIDEIIRRYHGVSSIRRENGQYIVDAMLSVMVHKDG